MTKRNFAAYALIAVVFTFGLVTTTPNDEHLPCVGCPVVAQEQQPSIQVAALENTDHARG